MKEKLFLKIVLIALLFLTIYTLSVYIHHSVTLQLSTFIKQYGLIFKLHTFYLLVPIVLLILPIIKRKVLFKNIAIGLVIIFVWVFFLNYFQTEKLIFNHLFLPLKWFKNNNNPQFVKIVLWFLLLLIFFMKVMYLKIKRKKLYIEEIFLPIIASSIMVTTLVFHYIIPFTMYQYDLLFVNQSYEKIISHSDYYQIFCKYHDVCYTIDKKNQIFQKNQRILLQNQNLNQYIQKMNQYFLNHPQIKSSFIDDFGNFTTGHFDYTIIAYHMSLHHKENDLMIDNHVMYSFSRMMELIFTFLTIIAHSIWTIGGLFLYIKHKKVN